MTLATSTDTLDVGESRTFGLSPGSALTIVAPPNVRATITETPNTVSASGVGGNASRTHNLQLAQTVTYGPYPMGGTVMVANASDSGTAITWVRSDSIMAESASGSVSLVDKDGNPVGGVHPAFLGQVSTRTIMANNFHSAATAATMSRTAHVARDNISRLKLVYQNWYVAASVSPSDGSESSTGAAMGITASIEYPSGTFTRVLFSGVAQGSAADLATLASDYCDISIPYGAAFWVRTYQTNANGTVYSSSAAAISGEGYISSGATDMTLGGTVTATSANVYGPCAIVAMTTRPSAFLFGDSLVAGQSDVGDTGTNIGMLARIFGDTHAYIKCAVGSDQAQWAATKSTRRVALAAYCTHVFCNFGINDISTGGQTAAQVVASNTTIRNLFSTMPFYLCTLLPRASSTNGWTDVAGQTSLNTAARRSYNSQIRHAAVPLVSGVLDTALAVESLTNAAGALDPGNGCWQAVGFSRSTTGDGNITSGSTTYTSATAAFTAGDTGGLIYIAGAGTAGAALVATMTYVNSTTVTLTTARGTGGGQTASTTVTTADARINCLPLCEDGTHPFKAGYKMIANANRSAVALLV